MTFVKKVSPGVEASSQYRPPYSEATGSKSTSHNSEKEYGLYGDLVEW